MSPLGLFVSSTRQRANEWLSRLPVRTLRLPHAFLTRGCVVASSQGFLRRRLLVVSLGAHHAPALTSTSTSPSALKGILDLGLTGCSL